MQVQKNWEKNLILKIWKYVCPTSPPSYFSHLLANSALAENTNHANISFVPFMFKNKNVVSLARSSSAVI